MQNIIPLVQLPHLASAILAHLHSKPPLEVDPCTYCKSPTEVKRNISLNKELTHRIYCT